MINLMTFFGNPAPVVRVSASYSSVGDLNAHPQLLGPTEKFCLSSHLSSGVFLFAYTAFAVWRMFFFSYATPMTSSA